MSKAVCFACSHKWNGKKKAAKGHLVLFSLFSHSPFSLCALPFHQILTHHQNRLLLFRVFFYVCLWRIMLYTVVLIFIRDTDRSVVDNVIKGNSKQTHTKGNEKTGCVETRSATAIFGCGMFLSLDPTPPFINQRYYTATQPVGFFWCIHNWFVTNKRKEREKTAKRCSNRRLSGWK